MERAAVNSLTPAAVAFEDGLGERHHILDPTGTDTLEVLCLREELSAVPSFEFALRERVSRLAAFRHASFGRVRAVERLADRRATLAVVSDATPGARLSELLAQSSERRLNLDINSALCLIRQLVPAIAALHEFGRDIPGFAHGALAPERLVVTRDGRLIVVEYAMGAALEQLRLPPDRFWRDLRVALPRAGGLARFDQRVDVTQMGIVALSLILGRMLREDEYPSRIADVVASTWAISARGGFEPLPPGLRSWLGRALQLDPRTAFATAVEARAEFEKLLADSEFLAAPASLEAFLARFNDSSSRPDIRLDPPAPSRPPVWAEVRPVTQAEVVHPEAVRPEVRLAPLTPAPVAAAPLPRRAPVELAPLKAAPAPPPTVPLAAPIASPPPFEYNPEPALFQSAEPPARRISKRTAVVVAVIVALLGGAYVAARQVFSRPAPVDVETGSLVITTNPDGAQIFVDGEPRGLTPITLTLDPGPHTVELRGAGEPRTIPVTIRAGMQASQYIELAPAATASSAGQLQIRTDPPGARVMVDGAARGTSPTVVPDLTPGEHIVQLDSDLGSVRQTVTIEAGATASLVVPLGTPSGAPVSGWLAVKTPVDVQIFERGRLLGTNLTDRIMVPAGRHDVEIVNETLGYRVTRSLQVAPGKVAQVSIDVPTGTIALNAIPWAEVWIDGEKVGETPLGNLAVSIGSHSVVFRHPELGEQHHTALVTLKEPTRLSVDLRKR